MIQDQRGIGEMPDYAAYLLRLWRERSGESTRWRASLQDTHSGERVGFANPEEMFGYLRREMGDLPERNGETLADGAATGEGEP